MAGGIERVGRRRVTWRPDSAGSEGPEEGPADEVVRDLGDRAREARETPVDDTGGGADDARDRWLRAQRPPHWE